MEDKNQEILVKLTKAVNLVYEQPRKLFIRQFFLGLFYGLGTTIGVAVVLALLGYFVKLLGGLPIIGDWVNSISDL